jgi:hypothetical protein
MFDSALSAPVVVGLSLEGGYSRAHHRAARTVRESEPSASGAPRYETEGSERRTLGTVAVAPDAQWAGTLTVPIPGAHVAFIQIERSGPLPAGYRGSEETAAFSVPVGEIDAVLAVLAGLVASARGDGVLPSSSPGE